MKQTNRISDFDLVQILLRYRRKLQIAPWSLSKDYGDRLFIAINLEVIAPTTLHDVRHVISLHTLRHTALTTMGWATDSASDGSGQAVPTGIIVAYSRRTHSDSISSSPGSAGHL